MIKINESELNLRESFGYFLIVLVGLFLRWYQLDARPFHHDESLHAVYGAYNYFQGDYQFYRYTALLHGPVLYDILPFFYDLFGFNDFGARSPIAVIGSLFIFFPLFFKSFLGKRTFLIATAVISLSPTLIYYSRFLREDYLVLLAMALMMAGLFVVPKALKVPLVLFGFALHYCVKENVFITMSFILGYFIYEWSMNKVFHLQYESLIYKAAKFMKEHWLSSVIGLASAIYFFCWIFSAQFRHMRGILDGLYRDSLLYWLNQHNVERIKGPFVFQFLTLSWYESLFILTYFVQTLFVFKDFTKKFKIAAIAIIIISLITYALVDHNSLETNPVWLFFKLKEKVDAWWLIQLVGFSILVPTHHLLKQNRLLSTFAYLFYASFFTYSFVGEKVPWLCLYPLFFGLCYFIMYFKNSINQLDITPNKRVVITVLATLLIFFNLRATYKFSFLKAGSENEYISQVHTTQDFKEVGDMIKKQMRFPLKTNAKTLVMGDAIWPLSWFFYGEEDYVYIAGIHPEEDYQYIFKNYQASVENPENYDHTTLKLRGWWVPDMSKLTLKSYFLYMLFHNPWSETGFTYVEFFQKKVLAEIKEPEKNSKR